MAEKLSNPASSREHLTQPEEPPPVLGTWRRLYALVIGWLFLLVVVFYLFARRYAP